MPTGARLIYVIRDGRAEIPDAETELQAGDQVLAILEPGKESNGRGKSKAGEASNGRRKSKAAEEQTS